ncbi:MAG: ATP-binding protein, partial [Burkholderiales bacterium]
MTAMNTALHDPIFVGNSEMADRMRAFDWAASDVGSPAQWPENLRVAVHLCLSSRFPICLWWGRDLAMLYNDAFLPWLGEAKHPRALMQPGREVWPEIWDMIGPMLDSVIATGEATYSEDTQLFYDRKLPKEEVYITWSFSAIFSADGRTVDGVFCPCSENTEKVVGARRLETLRRLGIRPAEERTVDAACKEAAAVLAQNSCDVPFAAIYVVEPATREARLAATALTEHDRLLPDIVSASEGDKHSPWPLAAVLRTKRSVGCARLVEHGVRIRAAPWAEYVDTALVVPIQAAEDQLWGLLVAGVSTRRPLDAEYRTFFDLVAGHVGTAISDARAHEAQRQRAEALAEIDHAKTAFFSNVSHEFRTPLTLLLGPLEDMLARADGSVTVERGELDLVHRNSLRLLKLVNTLLDFSRIEVGRVQASYEPLDLPAVTADLASLFRAAIEKAGMRLSIDCPPLGEPVYVDRSMWEKIVLNLLSNAFKFTFEGEIEVSLHRAGACAELSVRDTGTGIAEHDVPRIFERFHRIEGARGRTYEGSRIGLELVQELAKLHDGTVRAESTLGRGSRFMVSVPLGHAHLPAAHIGAKQASTALGANAFAEEALRWLPDELGNESPVTADPTAEIGPSERILFADDNADLRQYVHHLLSPTHRLQLVADGEAALAAALENPPELVLTDVMMPRLDGFGLIKALRADPRTRDVRVIMLSARAGEEARVEGLAAGANDYLVKPFSARELLARVNSNLETSRATREALAREQRLRKTAEDAETHSKEELAAELAAMTSLHQLNGRLLAKTKLQPLLEEVLDASMALMAADFGNVQLYDEHTRKLKIVAQRGFKQEFLDY